MFISFSRLLLLLASSLVNALPTASPWSNPLSCDRESDNYNFKLCTREIDDLIRRAQRSIQRIEIIGMNLDEVIGSSVRLRFCTRTGAYLTSDNFHHTLYYQRDYQYDTTATQCDLSSSRQLERCPTTRGRTTSSYRGGRLLFDPFPLDS